MNNTDYKKIYSENMNGLTWDTGKFVVHHIDRNRKNNNFENLVLLPQKLHREFHNALEQIEPFRDTYSDVISPEPKYYNELCMFDWYFSKFWKLKLEVSFFWTLKIEYQRGVFPIGFDRNNKSFENYIKFFSYRMFEKYCVTEKERE